VLGIIHGVLAFFHALPFKSGSDWVYFVTLPAFLNIHLSRLWDWPGCKSPYWDTAHYGNIVTVMQRLLPDNKNIKSPPYSFFFTCDLLSGQEHKLSRLGEDISSTSYEACKLFQDGKGMLIDRLN
jgi:hypothetical protein